MKIEATAMDKPTQNETIKDLEFQYELAVKNRKKLKRAMDIAQIAATQAKYELAKARAKEDLIRAEIVAQKHMGKFGT